MGIHRSPQECVADHLDQGPDSRCREHLFNGPIKQYGQFRAEFVIACPDEISDRDSRKGMEPKGAISHGQRLSVEMRGCSAEPLKIVAVALQHRGQRQGMITGKVVGLLQILGTDKVFSQRQEGIHPVEIEKCDHGHHGIIEVLPASPDQDLDTPSADIDPEFPVQTSKLQPAFRMGLRQGPIA